MPITDRMREQYDSLRDKYVGRLPDGFEAADASQQLVDEAYWVIRAVVDSIPPDGSPKAKLVVLSNDLGVHCEADGEFEWKSAFEIGCALRGYSNGPRLGRYEAIRGLFERAHTDQVINYVQRHPEFPVGQLLASGTLVPLLPSRPVDGIDHASPRQTDIVLGLDQGNELSAATRNSAYLMLSDSRIACKALHPSGNICLRILTQDEAALVLDAHANHEHRLRVMPDEDGAQAGANDSQACAPEGV